MRVGALYPQTELHGDPSAVRQIGQAVEALNFGHLLAHDHVLGAVHSGRTPELTGPFTNKDPFHDPLTMFAYLAAVTQHIELVTGILVLPQRPTALVARQAADVDLLSGGRLRLGVAVGWNYVEYEALGQPFHARGAREEEQIELLRRLFTEPVVSFASRVALTVSIEPLSTPSRKVRSQSGSAGQAQQPSNAPPTSATDSSSSATASTRQSATGTSYASESTNLTDRSTDSAPSTSPLRRQI